MNQTSFKFGGSTAQERVEFRGCSIRVLVLEEIGDRPLYISLIDQRYFGQKSSPHQPFHIVLNS